MKKAESGPIKQNDPKEGMIWVWNDQNKNNLLKSILKKLSKNVTTCLKRFNIY